MANSCAFRVQKDLKEVMQNPNVDSPPIYVACVEDKLDHVVAMLVGPPQTPYHFGFFSFDMRFPQTYPNEPPKVRLRGRFCCLQTRDAKKREEEEEEEEKRRMRQKKTKKNPQYFLHR